VSVGSTGMRIGDTHDAVIASGITRTQLVQYAGASGDYNPLHTDEVYATEQAGYPSVFAHGMLTMGMTARMLTDWFGDVRLVRYGVRFTKQVWPGDTLTARATIDDIKDEPAGTVATVTVVTTNQNGQTVLSGYAAARIDD
jgi:acyl dehydratase